MYEEESNKKKCYVSIFYLSSWMELTEWHDYTF